MELVLDDLAAGILAAAMDAVIILDRDGIVLHWNPAAERLFDRRATDALGRDLTDLVVPEDLRERHRTAMSRVVDDEHHTVLNRRLEVRALRDGAEFPVELTITRTEYAGDIVFVGYLRDISERRRVLADLQASRRRLVTVSDEARRRIEHDLHDGAQQQLVSAAMTVTAANAALESDVHAARTLIERAGQQLQEAIASLRELARGLHPDVLTRRGLSGAVADMARRSGIVVDVGAVDVGRLPTDIEVAAYYVLTESLTNAAKHGARRAGIEVTLTGRVESTRPGGDTDRELVLVVTDDGPGGADPDGGTGLRGLMDRWAAVGGDLTVVSPPGLGTTVTARLVVGAAPSGPTAATG